ncbi:MAG: recombinase [Sphingobacterium sp.]|nr:recombinase [Sphingobacterium sp.]
MSINYSLLFYLKKPKNYVSGPKPIYMRITVDGIPKEVSTGRECDPSKWNSEANRARGTKTKANIEAGTGTKINVTVEKREEVTKTYKTN